MAPIMLDQIISKMIGIIHMKEIITEAMAITPTHMAIRKEIITEVEITIFTTILIDDGKIANIIWEIWNDGDFYYYVLYINIFFVLQTYLCQDYLLNNIMYCIYVIISRFYYLAP